MAALMYARTMRLEDSITELTRTIAQLRAEQHSPLWPDDDELPDDIADDHIHLHAVPSHHSVIRS